MNDPPEQPLQIIKGRFLIAAQSTLLPTSPPRTYYDIMATSANRNRAPMLTSGYIQRHSQGLGASSLWKNKEGYSMKTSRLSNMAREYRGCRPGIISARGEGARDLRMLAAAGSYSRNNPSFSKKDEDRYSKRLFSPERADPFQITATQQLSNVLQKPDPPQGLILESIDPPSKVTHKHRRLRRSRSRSRSKEKSRHSSKRRDRERKYRRSGSPDAKIGVHHQSTSSSTFEGLLSLQNFDGSWGDIDDILKQFPEFKELRDIPTQIINIENYDQGEKETIYATLLAINIMNKLFQKNRNQWKLIESKAKNWLKSKKVKYEDYRILLSK